MKKINKKRIKEIKTFINNINSEIQNLNSGLSKPPNLNSNEGKKLLDAIESKVNMINSTLIDLEEAHLGNIF